jgi:serine protease Do
MVADSRSGVAILKVDAETPFLTLGKSRELELASPVLAVGYPMDLPLTPSFGTVGGFDMKYLGAYFATRHIRANVSVQRGEGGAPLVNMRGEAVAILIASIDQGSASFAVTIEAAEKVRRDFVKFGEPRPGWLGIEVGQAAAPVAGSTAEVIDLLPDAPAMKSGVEKGDILIEIGDRKITAPEDVLDASFFITADEELTMKVARAGTDLALKLQPTEHPAVRRDNGVHPALPVLSRSEFPLPAEK